LELMMKYEPIERPAAPDRESLFRDFGLIGRAIAEAFRGMSSSSRLESRWSKMRSCGGEC
jgi:hypothetical protein